MSRSRSRGLAPTASMLDIVNLFSRQYRCKPVFPSYCVPARMAVSLANRISRGLFCWNSECACCFHGRSTARPMAPVKTTHPPADLSAGKRRHSSLGMGFIARISTSAPMPLDGPQRELPRSHKGHDGNVGATCGRPLHQQAVTGDRQADRAAILPRSPLQISAVQDMASSVFSLGMGFIARIPPQRAV
jgi:hypothetical protein